MLPIKKGPQPQELQDAVRRIKGTPSTTLSWNHVDHVERQATLAALLRDQGGLCAYCMRPIDKDTGHVEHIIPQSEHRGSDDPDSVDYHNMLAVCDGFEGNPAGQTCDRARGDRPLAVSPLNARQVGRITYLRDGTIGSDDADINDCLNKTLNLNQAMLKRNRKAALDASHRALERQGRRGRGAVVSFCKKYVADHLDKPEERRPYDGIVMYFMRKRIRAAS